MRNWFLVSAALLAIPANAYGDETLKWRHVQHATTFQTVEVGDTKGHVLNVYRLPGLATFPDGSIGSTAVIGESDVTNGGGAINGYMVLKTKDGSELWLKYTGSITADGVRKGTEFVIGGTGKYQGVKGEGTFEGNGTQIGPDLISYIDNVITIKK
jgi:hypothetical protein